LNYWNGYPRVFGYLRVWLLLLAARRGHPGIQSGGWFGFAVPNYPASGKAGLSGGNLPSAARFGCELGVQRMKFGSPVPSCGYTRSEGTG